MKASGFGFSGSGSGSGGECNEQAKSEMQFSQNAYAEQSSEQVVVGGKAEGMFSFIDAFTVTYSSCKCRCSKKQLTLLTLYLFSK